MTELTRVRRGRGLRWIALGLGLLAYGLYTGFTGGQITNDEAWFVQVLRRVAGGEDLYSDVFFGSTPLTVYLTLPLIKALGAEMGALKLMMALVLTATAILLLYSGRRLGLGETAQALILVGFLAYTPASLPGGGKPYTPVAYLFLLASMVALLQLINGTERPSASRSSLIAGGLLGAAFASKQHIGLLGLAAAMVCLTYMGRGLDSAGRRTLVGRGGEMIAGFVTLAGAVLLPVLLQGALGKFLEYGFLNRGLYLRVAGVSYWDQAIAALDLIRPGTAGSSLLQAYWRVQYLLPLAAVGAALWRTARSQGADRARGVTICSFGVAAWIGVFPRADLPHVSPALPLMLLALAWGLMPETARLAPREGRLLRGAAVLWPAVGLVALVLRPIGWYASGQYEIARRPRLTGLLLPTSELARLERGLEWVRAEVGAQPLFFLSPSAGLYYLLLDRSNPTPFDYPLVTAFGFDGEAQVRAQIERGEIDWVCWEPLPRQVLRPALLEGYVAEEMELILEGALCDLYRTGSLAGGGGDQDRGGELLS